jgi:hypothetical protein
LLWEVGTASGHENVWKPLVLAQPRGSHFHATTLVDKTAERVFGPVSASKSPDEGGLPLPSGPRKGLGMVGARAARQPDRRRLRVGAARSASATGRDMGTAGFEPATSTRSRTERTRAAYDQHSTRQPACARIRSRGRDVARPFKPRGAGSVTSLCSSRRMSARSAL